MTIERDKFLTEAMGECWHERADTDHTTSAYYGCKHCGKMMCFSPNNYNNFSTWEGFGKLWEWAQKQEWWAYMNFIGEYTEQNTAAEFTHEKCIIHPDRFADAVYSYLKEKP